MRYQAAITATFFLATTSVVYAQSINSIPNGFRELKWGSSRTTDFVLSKGNCYTRPVDDLRIGRITAKRISYVFENNGLSKVNFVFEGESAQRLESVFTDNFGEGNLTEDTSTGSRYISWKSPQTTVLMVVNVTDGRSAGLVFFSERK